MKATVFIVDDDLSLLRALTRALGGAGYQVEAFSSAAEFLRHPPHLGPCCLIADLKMSGMDGLQLQTELAARSGAPPIVFLTGQASVPDAVRAMKAGASDFLTKPVDVDSLLQAVHRAILAYREQLERRLEESSRRIRLERLTPRERQVCELVVQGKLNKQIASELGTAEKTVKIQRAKAMAKLEVTSVAELVDVFRRVISSHGA